MAKAFKISCILMHWYVYDAVQDWKDLVMRLETLLEFQVLIPEWMRKKVEANTASASFIKSRCGTLALNLTNGMGMKLKEEAEGSKHGGYM